MILNHEVKLLLFIKMKDNYQLIIRIMYWNVNDQVHKIFIKDTIYAIQKQINIKFIQNQNLSLKLQRVHDIQMYLQKAQHISQKCQPLSLQSRAVFVPKRSYLETNNRSYKSGSNFLQKWEVNPLQNVLYCMCHTNVKHNIMSSKSNNF